MARVVSLDHVVVRVSNIERSRAFYGRLFSFLGFESMDDFSNMTGWRNGKIAFWISSAKGTIELCRHRQGSAGLHHCGFEVRNRKDIDQLQSFLIEVGAEIVDPAREYYQDYYAVYFRDPDGLKIEGMTYGPTHLHGARRKRAAR